MWIATRSLVTKYGPKSDASPSIGTPCPLCGIGFAAGDFTTLVRATRGSKYGNTPIEVHWDCAQYNADD